MVANGFKLFLIVFLALFASIPSLCQNQNRRAVIVEFTHSVFDPLTASFPNVFLENPALEAHILSAADSLIRTHFHGYEVIQKNEIDFQHYNTNVLGRPEIFRKIDRTSGDFFFSIRSYISPTIKSSFNFTLKIWGEDKADNVIFKENIKTQFSVTDAAKEQKIQGYKALAPGDFGRLYDEALLGAFHKKKKLSPKTYQRPPDLFLTSFAAEARKYHLVAGKKNHFHYLVQDSAQNSLGIVGVEEQAAIDKKLGNFLNYLIEKSAARKAAEFHLQNDLHQTRYVVEIWGKGYDDGELDVEVTFLQDENTIGKVYYQPCFIEGTLYENRYIMECDYQVLKFHQEGTGMVALITLDQQQAYFSPILTQEAIGEIMNVYLAWQIADEIAGRIYSALDNRAGEQEDE